MPSTFTSRLEGLTTSVAVKAPCRVATTAAITLSGLQTIDGVALSAGDRVLVKNQSSTVDNGIWIASVGAWTRAADFDGTLDAVGGTQAMVLGGGVNGNTYWRVVGSGDVGIGRDQVQFEAALVNDSATVSWQRGESAKVQTVAEKLGLIEVLATDFENVAPDKSAECAVACQNAINKAIQAGFRRIRFPAFGSGDQGYVIGETLYSKDTSGDSGPSGAQIAIVGDGKDSTMFWPDDEFTAVHIVTSSWASGGFGVTFPDDTPSGRASTRIGVAFADDDHQVARCEISDIVVRNAYRSFVLEQHGGSLGTMWLVTLRRLISQGAANWGIRLDSKTGSTTLRLDQVHVDAGTTGGKGAYINNFNDVFGNIAIDKCDNDWLEIVNANVVNLEELALEGCTHDSTTGSVRINSQIAIIQAVKELACIYDPGVGNTAPVVNLGANVLSARVGGWSSQANTITSGSRAKVRLGVATTHCHVIDRSILPSEVVHNGFFANYVFEGRRLSITGTVPNYGAWLRGDHVQNGAPATGQPKGWMCETSGSPGTWTSEGNL